MPTIKKILLPLDFSEASPVLLQYASLFAEKNDAKVVIVSVAEDPFTYTGIPVEMQLIPVEDSVEQNAKKRMESFLHENKDMLPSGSENVVLAGHPAEEIVTFAAEKKMDLIIIGTHGFKGLERMIFGSVAEKVIKMSPCPVLTVNTYKKSVG